MDFSWSTIWVIWHIPETREEYVSPLYVYRTMGVICVSPLPTTMNAFTYTCNIRILMNLFFRRHGSTRVLDMSYAPNQNIFEHTISKYFKLK